MNTRETLLTLRRYESRNVTCMAPDGGWPIVWERARGCEVRTPEGRTYLDLTAAFGVAAAGHANPRVVAAACRQMKRLPHAMGDVHPHSLKAKLAKAIVESVFGRNGVRGGKVLFCNAGFEAVEAAMKTAHLATGNPGVIAFEGAYHGLGYGALNVTHRDHFRGPFLAQLAQFGSFIPFPSDNRSMERTLAAVAKAARRGDMGAILVEPVQARGGIRVPPPGFLTALRKIADERGLLLILDEIYTGFGRTGRWFAFEHEAMTPDLICLGKALTGGFPLAVCAGAEGVMDAWPRTTGEAIHTSTFLGHPVGCAMALAQMEELGRRNLPERALKLGEWLGPKLASIRPPTPDHVLAARCLGLMAGLEIRTSDGRPAGDASFAIVRALLDDGFIALPEGAHGEIIGFTPPLTIARTVLERAVTALNDAVQRVLAPRRRGKR
jgi:4-aminobutyrate aminotransferase-like enzyme